MRRLLRVASLGAVLAVAGASWYFFAPAELGGSTSFAVVYGSSMEPHLHRGDLVILRGHRDYRRGEVVGYHSTELHRNVLHRIVAVRGGRFVFKGDNNNFLDPEQPLGGQLFGTEWVVVPRAGAVLEQLRTPRDAAIAGGLAVLLVLGTGAGPGVRRRRRPSAPEPTRVSAAPVATVAPPPPEPRPRSWLRSGALTLGVVGLAALALGAAVGVLALRQPAHRTVAEPGLVVQRGTFSWSAPAPVGAVYQRPSLRPADPVFLRLVHALAVRFSYRVHSRHTAAFAGDAALDAVLSDGSGWRRRLVVAPRRAFQGGRVTLAGTLDLDALTRTITLFEAKTGAHNPAYHLELAPRVHVHGVAGDRAIREAFSPPLAFDLDELRLQLAHPPGGASNALVRTKSLDGTHTTTSTLALFGRRVTVSGARRFAVALAGAGLGLALAACALLLLRRRDDELETIQRRFGDLIVPVTPGLQRNSSEHRVATIDALVRIAERYDRLILHETRGGGHSFLVDDAGVVYRYDIGSQPEETTEIRLDAALRPRPSHLQAADR